MGMAPQTTQQRLFVLDSQLTALVNTVADLREGGLIEDGPYASMAGTLHHADTAMDTAWIALGQGDMDTVAGQMAVINKLLYSVRASLPEATP